MKILVTGSRGFVGQALALSLDQEGFDVIRGVRKNPQKNEVMHGDIDSNTNWHELLSGCEVVVHAAARVHVMHENEINSLYSYRLANFHGTINLARQAAASGVKLFIFISTLKVTGESGIFKSVDCAEPNDFYAKSKYEAEQELMQIHKKNSEMKVVILRPPLIYGPEVKANFYKLMKLADLSIPLPLSGVRNQRSLLFVGNLIDAILRIIKVKEIESGIYHISDGPPISSADLIRQISALMGKKIIIFYLPPSLIKLIAKYTGMKNQVDRLVQNLYTDDEKLNEKIGWMPPYTTLDGLRTTVDWYLKNKI
ncbi:MAG: hypothetical protein RLY43_938 [Bacteroidota bacterium]|jgi:nucleoside-diphosphate-sugar epimerase